MTPLSQYVFYTSIPDYVIVLACFNFELLCEKRARQRKEEEKNMFDQIIPNTNFECVLAVVPNNCLISHWPLINKYSTSINKSTVPVIVLKWATRLINTCHWVIIKAVCFLFLLVKIYISVLSINSSIRREKSTYKKP